MYKRQHLAPVHRASPNADHADILSLLCCCTDDVIHVIPITLYAFLIDVFEVVSVNHRILSVDIHRRNIIQRLNLNPATSRVVVYALRKVDDAYMVDNITECSINGSIDLSLIHIYLD